ncbi:MAG: hypothetical protein QXP31_08395 [Pyrobaculum sp.]
MLALLSAVAKRRGLPHCSHGDHAVLTDVPCEDAEGGELVCSFK